MAVKIDRVDMLDAEEVDGRLERVVRRVRVTGLTETDYSVLFEALDSVGVPVAGDLLEALPGVLIAPDQTPLVLRKRGVRLHEEDPSVCDIDLTYEFPLNDGQDLSSPIFGGPIVAVKASVQQIQSNTDINGDLIVVQHTYPANDPDYPGQTRAQGGVVEYFQPQHTLHLRGIYTIGFPSIKANKMIGHLNADQNWGGGAPRTWLCTAANYEPHDYSTKSTPNTRWRFDFEFQYNPDTWDPTVVFIDDRTGKPPTGLAPGVGYRQVTKHPESIFAQIVGTIGLVV